MRHARQDRALARVMRRLWRRGLCSECDNAIRVRFRYGTCSVECENEATADMGV